MMKISRYKNPVIESHTLLPHFTMESDPDKSIRGLRILVVDDAMDTAFTLARVLMQEGALVRWTTSVAEAWGMIDSFHPNLIVSDLSMPQEDGFDLIKKFRSTHALSEGDFVPAVAISAYGSPTMMQRSFEEGYQAFFPKPVKAQYLIEALAGLNQVYRSLRDARSEPARTSNASGAF